VSGHCLSVISEEESQLTDQLIAEVTVKGSRHYSKDENFLFFRLKSGEYLQSMFPLTVQR
jgi:hypothetical protein